jgi:uroporphyrinogen decarboxylase
MNSRQRVLAALNFETPDRTPVVIGASNATGMRQKTYAQLQARLGLEGEIEYLYDWPELGSVRMSEAMLQALHSDVRSVWDRFPAHIYARNQARPPHAPFIDDWGIGQVEIEPGVWTQGIHPLAGAQTLADLEAYAWPDMQDPSRLAHLQTDVQRWSQAGGNASEYALMGAPWLMFPFERAMALLGMENLMVHMATNPEFVQALLARITALCKQHMGNFLREAGDALDMIKIGDDLGAQQRPLISPVMYRRLLKPFHADFIAFIKERTQAKVFFHSDGDVFDLVEDFIEIGVDILNPVQTSAGKMGQLEALKRRYGKHLVFCGAIDTQTILSHGTPEAVRAEVQRVSAILGQGGGYLLSAVHTITDNVPVENVLAMVAAAQA